MAVGGVPGCAKPEGDRVEIRCEADRNAVAPVVFRITHPIQPSLTIFRWESKISHVNPGFAGMKPLSSVFPHDLLGDSKHRRESDRKRIIPLPYGGPSPVSSSDLSAPRPHVSERMRVLASGQVKRDCVRTRVSRRQCAVRGGRRQEESSELAERLERAEWGEGASCKL